MVQGRWSTSGAAVPCRDQIIAGRYRLVHPLGAGGMASVWRGEQLSTGLPVAIKIIAPELVSVPGAIDRLRAEARAVAQLRSRHVVQIHDHDVDGELGPFIAMELLEGESLASRQTRLGALEPAQVSAIVSQIAKGLSKAHAAGIIHRDLKPENVFLVWDEDGTEIAKVLDFGVAKVPLALASGLTAHGLLVGTLCYMSPEQALGGVVDHRTDLWALGVIAFQCLVGRLPFPDSSPGMLILAISTHPLPVPSRICPSVPASFDLWFEKACSRDPAQRYQSAQEMAAALEQACGSTACHDTQQDMHVDPGACGPYYLIHQEVTIGPLDAAVLKRGMVSDRIPASAFVWREGWSDWRSVGDVRAELAEVQPAPQDVLGPQPGLDGVGARSLLPPKAPTTIRAGMLDPAGGRAAQDEREGGADEACGEVYFVTDGDNTVGPVRASLLVRGLEAGKVPASALAWREGWDSWQLAEGVVRRIKAEGGLVSNQEPSELRDEPGLAAIGLKSILPPSAPPPSTGVRSRSPESGPNDAIFYLSNGDDTVGPVSGSLLRKGMEAGKFPNSALVWCKGWSRWFTVEELTPVLRFFPPSHSDELREEAGIGALASRSILPPDAPLSKRPVRDIR